MINIENKIKVSTKKEWWKMNSKHFFCVFPGEGVGESEIENFRFFLIVNYGEPQIYSMEPYIGMQYETDQQKRELIMAIKDELMSLSKEYFVTFVEES